MESENLLVPEPRPEEAAGGAEGGAEALAAAGSAESLAEDVAEPWPFDGGPDPAESAHAEPATPSPVPSKGLDRRLLAAGAVVLLLALIGALLLFQARRDVSSLQGELKALRAEVRRSQVLQDRGAVLRARAELQALRQTLPPELAPELDKADGILGGIDERLKAAP